MPDNASEQVKLTVTSLLFQPSALAAGVREPVIVGGALSSLTLTEPLPWLPTLSVAVAVLLVPPALMLENVQFEALPDTCCAPLKAPVTTTHWTSLSVPSVSVSVAPGFANKVVPLWNEPLPPLNAAVMVLAAYEDVAPSGAKA